MKSGPAPATAEVFWAKVRKTVGCWEWLGAKDVHGYGKVTRSGHQRGAHRLAYELLVGSVPAGLQLDHLCRNRACVKAEADEYGPAHLEAVTCRDNLLRGEGPGALAQRTNRCKRGHEYTPGNTYLWRGGRSCLICRRQASALGRVNREGALA